MFRGTALVWSWSIEGHVWVFLPFDTIFFLTALG